MLNQWNLNLNKTWTLIIIQVIRNWFFYLTHQFDSNQVSEHYISFRASFHHLGSQKNSQQWLRKMTEATFSVVEIILGIFYILKGLIIWLIVLSYAIPETRIWGIKIWNSQNDLFEQRSRVPVKSWIYSPCCLIIENVDCGEKKTGCWKVFEKIWAAAR